MNDYTTTTRKSNIVALETAKRMLSILADIFKKIMPFALGISLLIRFIIYVMLPAAIGQWTISENTIDIKLFSDSTRLLLTLPTLMQLPLFAAMLHFGYNIFYNASENIKITDSLLVVLKKLHIVVIASIIYMISTGIGCMLFILPGLYVLGAFSMAIPSIVLESKGAISSFKYSKSLTSGSILYALLVILCAIAIPNILILLIGSKIAAIISSRILNEIIIIIFVSISNIFLATSFIFLYGELKLRKIENEKIEEIRVQQESAATEQ